MGEKRISDCVVCVCVCMCVTVGWSEQEAAIEGGVKLQIVNLLKAFRVLRRKLSWKTFTKLGGDVERSSMHSNQYLTSFPPVRNVDSSNCGSEQYHSAGSAGSRLTWQVSNFTRPPFARAANRIRHSTKSKGVEPTVPRRPTGRSSRDERHHRAALSEQSR